MTEALCSALEDYLYYYTPNEQGVTRIDSMSQVAKHKGKEDEPVDMDHPPEAFMYIWDWFWDLNSMRQVGFSENALSPSDVGWWQNLSGAILRSWEFDMIRAMDKAYLSFKASQNKKKRDKKGKLNV